MASPETLWIYQMNGKQFRRIGIPAAWLEIWLVWNNHDAYNLNIKSNNCCTWGLFEWGAKRNIQLHVTRAYTAQCKHKWRCLSATSSRGNIAVNNISFIFFFSLKHSLDVESSSLAVVVTTFKWVADFFFFHSNNFRCTSTMLYDDELLPRGFESHQFDMHALDIYVYEIKPISECTQDKKSERIPKTRQKKCRSAIRFWGLRGDMVDEFSIFFFLLRNFGSSFQVDDSLT